MAQIPNYIVKKIERHNALVEKAASLEAEIDKWYERQFEKCGGNVDSIPDEDFADIKCDMTVKYISKENIQYNFELIKK